MNLREQVRGLWPTILPSLGIAPEYLRNRHMPCPGCGGNDRFRFDDKGGSGSFYCGGGGDPTSGDGFDLLKHVHGWDFAEAAKEVERVLGIDSRDRQAMPRKPMHLKTVPPPEPPKTQTYALELWEAADTSDTFVAAHPYAIRKDITWGCGAGRGSVTGKLVGKDADCLIVPQRTLKGELIGVESINEAGVKQSFGQKGVLILGNTLDKTVPVYVVEGWADGCATWKHFGNVVVVVVFGIGRQESLAQQLDEARPGREIVIVRDAA